jgi:hypothetical protein
MLSELKSLRVFDRITFNEKQHSYKIDNKTSARVSVTGLISTVKEKFDEDKWATIKGKEVGMSPDEMKAFWKLHNRVSTLQGSNLHSYIEYYYQNKIFASNVHRDKEELGEELYEKMRQNLRLLVPQFVNFYQDTKDEILPIKHEFVLGDLAHTKICGMLDLLAYNTKTDKFEIYDFKTNKAFNTASPFEKKLLPPLEHLDECEFNTYSLQLSLYKIFIEKYTDIKVDKLKIVWFSVNNESYKLIELKYMPEECSTILKKYLINNSND